MANFLKSLFVKGVEIDPAGAASDQVLKYNGTKFVPGTASTVGSIDDLSDVAITSPASNQILKYNGTLWTNASASSGNVVSDSPPSSPTAGQVWFESDTGKTFIYYDSYWVEISGGRGDTNPVGAVTAFAGSVAPTSWLLCAGQDVSRTVYAPLFAVIGTTYGAGDGTTTFTVPDMRGRAVAGLDNMGGTDAGRLSIANTLGTTAGAETVTLTSAQSGVPAHSHANTLTNNAVTSGAGSAHTHTQNAHGHTIVNPSTGSQIFYMGNGSAGYADQWGQGSQGGLSSGTPIQSTTATNQNESAHTHSVTSNVSISNVNNTAANAASAHDNMQPTILLNYIIKAL
jgi:microcystin-dependent protein